MKNKIVLISVLTFLLVIVISTTNSFATNMVVNEQNYSISDADFSITLPKTIIFDGSSPSVSYTITCNNNSDKIEKISVIPDSTFAMYQQNKESVIASISQPIISFKNSAITDVLESNETFDNTINGTITANLSAGNWYGTFDFHITYKEREYQNITINSETAKLPDIEMKDGTLIIPEIVEKDGEKYRVISIDEGTFEYNYEIKEIVLPESIQKIGKNAFNNCTVLTNIVIPANVLIDNNAFQYCTALETLTINENVIINENAFIGCSSLKEVIIKDNTIVEKNAFQYCTALNNIIFTGTADIQEAAFLGCTGIETIKLPNGLSAIRKSVFNNCSNLKTVEIPSTVETIEAEAFMYCSLLNTINIPNNVTTIENDAFNNCNNLELTIPNSVTNIGRNAFAYMQRIYYNGTATYEEDNLYWGAFNLN